MSVFVCVYKYMCMCLFVYMCLYMGVCVCVCMYMYACMPEYGCTYLNAFFFITEGILLNKTKIYAVTFLKNNFLNVMFGVS